MKRNLYKIVLAVGIILLCGCGNKARTIAVQECVGMSMVSNSKGEVEAYVGQHLDNGDSVNVGEESSLLLLLDADKHVFANNGAKFRVVAMYENKASKTLIEQSQGALLYGIDNPLKDTDTFMVSTHNVLLAVRGTVFTVDVEKDVTTLEVEEGTVYTETIENGEIVTMLVEAGEEVAFTGTAPTFHEVMFSGEISTATSTESEANEENEVEANVSDVSIGNGLTTSDVLTDVIEWDMHKVPTCVPGECSHMDCAHFYSTGSAYKVVSNEQESETINLAEGRLFSEGGYSDSGVNLPFQIECSQFEDCPPDLAEEDLWNPMQGWYYLDESAGIFRRCDTDSHGGN